MVFSRIIGDYEVLLDKDDYYEFMSFRIYIRHSKRTNLKYAFIPHLKNGVWKTILLHRFILPHITSGMVIDHINGDGLDNRKCNLRICTQQQNSLNRVSHKNSSSKYLGVSFHKNKYIARIKNKDTVLRLGSFTDEKLAAKAYNDAAIIYHGEYARLNII